MSNIALRIDPGQGGSSKVRNDRTSGNSSWGVRFNVSLLQSKARGVSDPAFLMFLALENHASEKRPWCWPSMERLAEITGKSLNSVRTLLDELQRAGWIKRCRGPRNCLMGFALVRRAQEGDTAADTPERLAQAGRALADRKGSSARHVRQQSDTPENGEPSLKDSGVSSLKLVGGSSLKDSGVSSLKKSGGSIEDEPSNFEPAQFEPPKEETNHRSLARSLDDLSRENGSVQTAIEPSSDSVFDLSRGENPDRPIAEPETQPEDPHSPDERTDDWDNEQVVGEYAIRMLRSVYSGHLDEAESDWGQWQPLWLKNARIILVKGIAQTSIDQIVAAIQQVPAKSRGKRFFKLLTPLLDGGVIARSSLMEVRTPEEKAKAESDALARTWISEPDPETEALNLMRSYEDEYVFSTLNGKVYADPIRPPFDVITPEKAAMFETLKPHKAHLVSILRRRSTIPRGSVDPRWSN